MKNVLLCPTRLLLNALIVLLPDLAEILQSSIEHCKLLFLISCMFYFYFFLCVIQFK